MEINSIFISGTEGQKLSFNFEKCTNNTTNFFSQYLFKGITLDNDIKKSNYAQAENIAAMLR